MVTGGQPTDRQRIHDELDRVRADLHDLVATASASGLRRRTDGTRWTNGQMLWHMAFGLLIVRRLLPLVHLFGRLPDPFSRAFAAMLNAGTRPFHHINYLGGVGGSARLSRPASDQAARPTPSTRFTAISTLSPKLHSTCGCTSQSTGTRSSPTR